MSVSPITVENAHAAVSRDAPISSEGFFNCNLILLKNTGTGQVLLMHSNFENRSEDPYFIPRFRQSKAAKDPEQPQRYSMRGVSDMQAPILKDFLEHAEGGQIYGISFYKNFHDQPAWGAKKDYKLTEFLESKGVKMRRHPIVAFEGGYELDGFNALYDPASDTLNLTRHEVDISALLPQHARTESLDNQSLLRIHPFADLKLWDKQKGAQR